MKEGNKLNAGMRPKEKLAAPVLVMELGQNAATVNGRRLIHLDSSMEPQRMKKGPRHAVVGWNDKKEAGRCTLAKKRRAW